MLAVLWRLLMNLVRDLVGTSSLDREDADARNDDLLDALLDEDEIDAMGL